MPVSFSGGYISNRSLGVNSSILGTQFSQFLKCFICFLVHLFFLFIQVRVVQGKETPVFLNLFKGEMIIHNGR